jgi:hypothetical protein
MMATDKESSGERVEEVMRDPGMQSARRACRATGMLIDRDSPDKSAIRRRRRSGIVPRRTPAYPEARLPCGMFNLAFADASQEIKLS